jgi:hypothetical protein
LKSGQDQAKKLLSKLLSADRKGEPRWD